MVVHYGNVLVGGRSPGRYFGPWICLLIPLVAIWTCTEIGNDAGAGLPRPNAFPRPRPIPPSPTLLDPSLPLREG